MAGTSVVAVAAMLDRSEVRAEPASEIALVSSDPIDETIAEASVVTGRGTIGVTPEVDALVVMEAGSVVAAAEVVITTLLCSVTNGTGATAVSLVLGATLNSGVVLSVELATKVGCRLPDATRLASVAEVATTEEVADVSSERVAETTELASGTRGTTAAVVVELAPVAGPVMPSTDEEFELLGREDAGDSAVVVGVEVPSMTVESPRMMPVAEVEVRVGADELTTMLVGWIMLDGEAPVGPTRKATEGDTDVADELKLSPVELVALDASELVEVGNTMTSGSPPVEATPSVLVVVG